MAFEKIVSPSLKDLFIQQITTMILSGEISIGDKLPTEREISQSMQISKTVVNSGIQELAKQGFLTIIPRKGTFVADYIKHGTINTAIAIMKYGNMNKEYIRSTLELRIILFDLALETAVRKCKQKDVDYLTSIIDKLECSKSIKEQIELLYEFDLSLTSLSDNLIVPILLTSFKVPNNILYEKYINNYGIESLLVRSKDIIKALQDHNVSKAQKISKESILNCIGGDTNIYGI